MITVPSIRQSVSLGRRVQRYESETLAQQTRIVADGGTVIDLAYMDTVIKALKAQSILTPAKFIADANIAVKKDGSGAVSKLYDISGNDNDAVQATGSAQPVWTAAQQGTRAGMVFDGNKYLAVASFTGQPTGDSSLSSLYVAKEPAFSGDQVVVSLGADGSGTAYGSYFKATGTKVSAEFASSRGLVSTGAIGTDSVLISTVYDKTADTHDIYTNGGDVQTTAYGPPNITAGGLSLGIWINLTASKLTGTIFDVAIFNIALTAPQRIAVETILNTYYAIY